MKENKSSPERDNFCVCWARNGRVMTPREEEILREIRLLKAQYDELKKALRSELDESKRRELEVRLQKLKVRREELEKLRLDAAKERMRLLGHED